MNLALTRYHTRALLTSGTPWAAATTSALLGGLLFWVNADDFTRYSRRAAADPYLLASINATQGVAQPTITNLGVVGALVIPFVTMRLIAEERRAGTTEWARTLPASDTATTTAKYIAALAATAVLLAVSITHPLALWIAGPITWSHVAAGYIGLAALYATLTATGLAISALAPSPGVAASVALTVNLGLIVAGLWTNPDDPGTVATIVRWSPITRLDPFSAGLVDVSALAWYATLTATALTITTIATTTERHRG